MMCRPRGCSGSSEVGDGGPEEPSPPSSPCCPSCLQFSPSRLPEEGRSARLYLRQPARTTASRSARTVCLAGTGMQCSLMEDAHAHAGI
jgi:hypothetical protein